MRAWSLVLPSRQAAASRVRLRLLCAVSIFIVERRVGGRVKDG